MLPKQPPIRLLLTPKQTWKPLATPWKPVLKKLLPKPTKLLLKSKLKSKAKPKPKLLPTNRARFANG